MVNGSASEALLDVFSSERVADARQICIEAGRSTRLMAPPSRGFRVMQQAVSSRALDQDWVRGLLHWRTSHPIDYADSPVTWRDATEAQFETGPHPGAPPRNVRLANKGGATGTNSFLLDAAGPCFTVLVFGDDTTLWHAAADDVRASVEQGLAVTLVAVRKDGITPKDADATLADADGHAHRLWGADDPPGQGTVYLLRPDQHIAARWKSGSATRLADVLRFVLSAGAEPSARLQSGVAAGPNRRHPPNCALMNWNLCTTSWPPPSMRYPRSARACCLPSSCSAWHMNSATPSAFLH